MAGFIDDLIDFKKDFLTYSGELSSFLDFGAPAQITPYRRNPEVDFSEVERGLDDDDEILGVKKTRTGYGLVAVGVVALLLIASKSAK